MNLHVYPWKKSLERIFRNILLTTISSCYFASNNEIQPKIYKYDHFFLFLLILLFLLFLRKCFFIFVIFSVNGCIVRRRLVITISSMFFYDSDWDHYANRRGNFGGILGSLIISNRDTSAPISLMKVVEKLDPLLFLPLKLNKFQSKHKKKKINGDKHNVKNI
jgi:hypothetical protein